MELKGKYSSCIIYTDNVDDEAIKVLYGILDHPSAKGQTIRIMPDVHAGKDIVVGFTSTIGDCINPKHIGVDIGCMMTLMRFSKKVPSEKYELFEHRIKEAVPVGMAIHEKASNKDIEKKLYAHLNSRYSSARSSWPEMIPEIAYIDEKYIQKFLKRINMDPKSFYKSLGTLGGGNHFLEYGECDDPDNDTGFFTIHCGSRNLGVKVCTYWSNKAQNMKNSDGSASANGYLYGEDMRGYLSDMVITQAYAEFNHLMIEAAITEIVSKFGIKTKKSLKSTHNYIDFSDMILRKGAVRANEGQRVIIPFNMRDGLAVCIGKGNETWNYSAPHGAGRIMSRNQAKNLITFEEYAESMKGIVSSSVCAGTIDESPMVYKPMTEILENIKPTVDVEFFVKPKINIKATDDIH